MEKTAIEWQLIEVRFKQSGMQRQEFCLVANLSDRSYTVRIVGCGWKILRYCKLNSRSSRWFVNETLGSQKLGNVFPSADVY